MGDKIMTPVVYQNRNGTESLYATHAVGNIHDGHWLPSPRRHQFTVTGNTIPAAPTQWQTMFSEIFKFTSCTGPTPTPTPPPHPTPAPHPPPP